VLGGDGFCVRHPEMVRGDRLTGSCTGLTIHSELFSVYWKIGAWHS